MSYDLFFRKDHAAPSRDTLRAFFEKIPDVSVTDGGVEYSNEDTGVYFGFDTHDGTVPFAFNINYYRPHVFALEAEPVLTNFVAHFGLDIEDPQGGMQGNQYSRDGFLHGWNEGNRAAYQVMRGKEVPYALPSARIESSWRWNRARGLGAEYLVDYVGELPPCFFPRVLYLTRAPGEVITGIVWDLKMAIAIPEVDVVLTNDENGLRHLPLANLRSLLRVEETWGAEHELATGRPIGLPALLVDGSPAATTAKVRAVMKPFVGKGLSTDVVLDAEMLAAGA